MKTPGVIRRSPFSTVSSFVATGFPVDLAARARELDAALDFEFLLNLLSGFPVLMSIPGLLDAIGLFAEEELVGTCGDRFIAVDFDFANILSSSFCSCILFAIVLGAACQSGTLSELFFCSWSGCHRYGVTHMVHAGCFQEQSNWNCLQCQLTTSSRQTSRSTLVVQKTDSHETPWLSTANRKCFCHQLRNLDQDKLETVCATCRIQHTKTKPETLGWRLIFHLRLKQPH